MGKAIAQKDVEAAIVRDLATDQIRRLFVIARWGSYYRVSSVDVVRRFGVSPATAKRDLRYLRKRGFILPYRRTV